MAVTAYLYSRFSSKVQAAGDSFRRQTDEAKAFCEANGLLLNTDYKDPAISAYTGKNLSDGALAAFIEAVKDGVVTRGSYLLVDTMDRLSRQKEGIVLNLLTSLTCIYGIRVVNLSEGHVLDETAETLDYMRVCIHAERAHKESKKKARDVKEAHDNDKARARAEGRPWTPVAPSWLSFTKQGQKGDKVIRFAPIPERVAVIQRIFDLYESGVPSTKIARMLNEEGVLTHYQFWQRRNPTKLNGEPRKRADKGQWTADSVFSLVCNRAVLGEYQPGVMDPSAKRGRRADGPPIAGYYGDPIIDEAQFLRVQALVEKRRAAPRRNSTKAFRNLFVGIGKCSECGGTFSLHSNTNSDSRDRTARLRCLSAHHGGTCNNRLRLPYLPFEEAFLAHVSDFDIPAEAPRADPRLAELETARLARDDLDKRVNRLLVQLSESEDTRIRRYYDDQVSRLDSLDVHIEALEKAGAQEQAQIPLKDHQSALASFLAKMREADGAALYALRAAVSTAICKIVEKIVFHPDGAVMVYVRGLDNFYLFKDGSLIGKADEALLRLVRSAIARSSGEHRFEDFIRRRDNGPGRPHSVEFILGPARGRAS
ncbi:recombinase family protein [uncultured Caulobacter sp.]|uniref:recombinase family protein n=1 Tax=uncultured Caulobacter sp. TaxID=158749 RepID=UPI002610A3FA|nr:recombinase family protein [uncultured Caulobacter sp.]